MLFQPVTSPDPGADTASSLLEARPEARYCTVILWRCRRADPRDHNEVIAKAIETALGVTAGRAAEKFARCYAACGGRKGLPARIGAPWEGETTIPFEFRP
jgi:hypothetical protein